MARLLFFAITSLDGYIEDESGDFTWAAPAEDVHAFTNDVIRPVGVHLYGRKMYETMVFWETNGDDDPIGRDFATLWRAADKVVFSRTLDAVSSERTRLEREFDASTLHAMKASSPTDISISGPELAAHAFAAGLIDDVHLLLVPMVVGGGKRALPAGLRARLELVNEHRFASGFVYLKYQVAAKGA